VPDITNMQVRCAIWLKSSSTSLLVAMEPPTDLSADSIRDEKVKVVRRCVGGRDEIAVNGAGSVRQGRY
jgi:hypothetical protein